MMELHMQNSVNFQLSTGLFQEIEGLRKRLEMETGFRMSVDAFYASLVIDGYTAYLDRVVKANFSVPAPLKAHVSEPLHSPPHSPSQAHMHSQKEVQSLSFSLMDWRKELRKSKVSDQAKEIGNFLFHRASSDRFISITLREIHLSVGSTLAMTNKFMNELRFVGFVCLEVPGRCRQPNRYRLVIPGAPNLHPAT
jgi:hypothetical protein